MKYQLLTPFRKLMGSFRISERELAKQGALSRTGIRRVLAGEENVSLQSIVHLAEHFTARTTVLVSQETGLPEYSVVATSMKIHEHEGAWKHYLMEFVDEFRRSHDPCLLLLSPVSQLAKRYKALLASTVLELCREQEMHPPAWAEKTYYLEKPWFVSGMESLKASALLESPLGFRQNNVFVLNNFLSRV